jgi:plasmid stabilization system protein ParE
LVPEYPLDTLREVFVSPYRILYRVKPTEIEIISVVHYRQLLPSDLQK